jgi:DNA invertase Pin-like site-specific DNA recombinase
MEEMSVMVIPAKKHRGNKAAGKEVKKLRVAAYCRVSTDTDEQATSYDEQVAHYTECIQKNPTWSFAGIYADDGISGTGTRKREEFLRMIDDCMAGKIDMVVTKSISRFARNTIDCLKYIRQLKAKNIPVIFEKENINTMDAKGEVLITIMASLAQQESESLSKNVKMGLQFRYQRGKVQVNHNWFLGYTKDEDGKLIIDPAQAEVVKRIYREYLEGKSCKKIAQGLEADDIPNGAGSTKWWDSNILQILKNEKYMGDALLQKTFTEDVLTKKRVENDGTVPQYYVQNSHEPIVSKEYYHEVQAEIARRSFLKDDQDRRSGYCSKYALTGVLVCGECGAPFRRVVWNNRGKKESVWRCRNRVTKGVDPCFAPTIHELDLHTAVVQAVQQVFGTRQTVMDQLQQNIKGVLVEDAATQAESYSTELEDLQKQLVKSVNEGKSYDDIADKIRSVKEKRDRALDIEASENEHEKQIREIQEFLDTHDRNALEYDDSLVRKLIKVITVHRHSLEFEFKSGTKIEIDL